MEAEKAEPVHEDEPLPQGEEEAPPGVRTAAVVRWAIIVAIALVAAFTFVRVAWVGTSATADTSAQYQCPMHPQIVQDQPGQCPICGMTLVPVQSDGRAGAGGDGAATVRARPPAEGPGAYYCPMHPDWTTDDPNARCPRCRMQAEPVPTPSEVREPVPGLEPVMLSADRIQSSSIRTAPATRKTVSVELRATGVVSIDERRFAEITARVPGWLQVARSNAVGDRVRRGEPLGAIESPDVLAASRELISVAALGRTQALAGADLVSPARQRLELLGLPRGAIDRVQRSGTPTGTVGLASPIAGHIIARPALPGSYVQRGAPIYQVADLSNVWVLAEMYARDIGRIALGQRAAVRVEGAPGPVAEGTVTYLYPIADPSTRTTKVRIELPNPDLVLRPGLIAEVVFSAEPREGVAIPAEALADTGEQQYVFVAHPGGQFEPRRVYAGPRVGDEVLIDRGLAAGEQVVVSSAFLLDSESRLRAAVRGASAAPGHSGHGGAAAPGQQSPGGAAAPGHQGHVEEREP